jgi:hypothetical protein
MNKKFLITGLVCTIVAFVVSFIVHGVLLASDYTALAAKGMFRTPEDSAGYFPFMILAHVLIGFAFAWIYMQGISAGQSWVSQGIRYAIAVICLTTIPMYLIYYAVQPMPGMTVAKQIVFDAIGMMITGLVAAFINKTPASSA